MRKVLPLLAFAPLAIAPSSAPAEQERPNIIVILSDDMGFSDIGCYGGEMRTPNLDALASNGLRFTQFYNTGRCCPTRASLLTGLYPHQAGIGHMMSDQGVDGYRGDLNDQSVTIAEVMSDAGYRSYAIGKWHVTRFDRPNASKHNWPLQRGFEKYYGTIWGASSYFDPGICRGNTWYSRDNDPEYRSDNYYFTNALSDNAVMFMQQHQEESPEKPFFMYVAYTAAHWPLHALEEDIAKYDGRFDAGYETLRQERVKRLEKLGIMNPEWQVTPAAKSWGDVEHKEWESRGMEVYAAMIDSMDQGIGKIVAELKAQGEFDNTLILYMQDNGGCAENFWREDRVEKFDKEFQPMQPDDLPPGIHPKQTRDGRPVRHGTSVMPGGPDTYSSYGEGWANVSNTPFREYKHWVHEGGIATPLIAHWPKGIDPSVRSSLVNDPAHLVDIMSTCVDVAEASYPTEYNGKHIVPMEGVSLSSSFEGKALQRAEPIFWEHEGNRAVRQGKWKLVAKENQPWELYDMAADRTEMNDLAKAKPDLIGTMAGSWDDWAARSNVLPLGAWRDVATKKYVQVRDGDHLAMRDSPAVGQSGFTVSVEILEPKGDGVLVAQGGVVRGYSFYVREGRLHFDLRIKKKLTTIAASETIGDAPVTAVAVLGEDGSVRVSANGKELAAQEGVGKLAKTPGDGISGGMDGGDPVGNYTAPFNYEGRLGKIAVRVGRLE